MQHARYKDPHLSVLLFMHVQANIFAHQNVAQNVLMFMVRPHQGVGSGQVLQTCTGKNKTLPPFMSLTVMGEIAGVNTASRAASS